MNKLYYAEAALLPSVDPNVIDFVTENGPEAAVRSGMINNVSELKACNGADPNLFFPDLQNQKAAKAAKRICRECLVRVDCLEDALARDERFGVFGGMTYRERNALVKSRKAVSSNE